MSKRGWNEKASQVVRCGLVALAVLLGLPASRAEAQAVQDCQPNQFVDRTAPGAVRDLNWDIPIANDQARCMQVGVGQTVVWHASPDFDTHPLAGSGGDNPNPIGLHDANGAVTFNATGTFGFICLNHSIMHGAIRVVVAPAPAPALSPWLAAALMLPLMASGWIVIRNQRNRGAAAGA